MNKKKTVLLAIFVMLLWGSLFPCVKLAYEAFQIDAGKPANLLLFAGVRFLICGGLIVAFCAVRGKNMQVGAPKQWFSVCLIGLFAVVLHYSCTYVGLAKTDSSKTAILKQLAVLVFIAFSFLFFKEDSFSIGKLLGALLGFAGIVALNVDASKIVFGAGEFLIIGASLCTVVSNVITKKSVQKIDAVVVTGYSQLIGGGILLVLGLCLGGNMGTISWKGVGVFAYICSASIVSYCLWYGILKNNHLSTLFIIKFTEPLFACVFGAVLLGENVFSWQYLIALVLVATGICLSALPARKKDVRTQANEVCESA